METRLHVIKATYIGEPGSLGYVTGRRYTLISWEEDGCIWIVPLKEFRGNVPMSEQGCPYGSLFSFLLNWKNVSL